MPLTTREVAEQAGILPGRITGLISSGRLKPPPKDCTGRFVWSPEDVAKVKEAAAIDRRWKQGRRPAA